MSWSQKRLLFMAISHISFISPMHAVIKSAICVPVGESCWSAWTRTDDSCGCGTLMWWPWSSRSWLHRSTVSCDYWLHGAHYVMYKVSCDLLIGAHYVHQLSCDYWLGLVMFRLNVHVTRLCLLMTENVVFLFCFQSLFQLWTSFR